MSEVPKNTEMQLTREISNLHKLLDDSRDKIVAMEEMLRNVEWGFPDIQGEVLGHRCLWCGAHKGHPHANNCKWSKLVGGNGND